MIVAEPDKNTGPERPLWLRDIHRYAHTIVAPYIEKDGNKDSWGYFLDGAFVTEAGEYIGDNTEVKALAAVWYRANQFHKILGELRRQAEKACNIIAALEGVKRHDVVLDDATWDIVNNMQLGSREQSALQSAIRDLRHIVLHHSKLNADQMRNVFRPKYKDKINGRLDRLIAQQEAMIASFVEIEKELGLPQTAYEVRQYALSQLLINVEEALEAVTPMRRETKDVELPEGFRQRIVDNEGTFFRARAQLKKWRDNPSQKFGGKMKEMALLLLKTSNNTAMLKDDSYHALSKRGARFFNRCGRVPNPYS